VLGQGFYSTFPGLTFKISLASNCSENHVQITVEGTQ
jgi:hypothetical protein